LKIVSCNLFGICYFTVGILNKMSQTKKQKKGQWGEKQASLFLQRNGYEIIKRNFEFYTLELKGEIDIIARDGDGVLSFVEVKTRGQGNGSAERATSVEKKVIKTRNIAIQYCLQNNIDIDRTKMKIEHVSVYPDKETKTVEFKKYVLEA